MSLARSRRTGTLTLSCRRGPGQTTTLIPRCPSRNWKPPASGRPVGAGHPTFGEAALQLLKNGYSPLPIRPGEKRPVLRGWASDPIDARKIEQWCGEFPDCGIGLRTGQLVAIDIDILDEELADAAEQRVRSRRHAASPCRPLAEAAPALPGRRAVPEACRRRDRGPRQRPAARGLWRPPRDRTPVFMAVRQDAARSRRRGFACR